MTEPPFADILVVDDEPDIRNLIAGVLTDEGYEVRTAATAEAALECVEQRLPALILLDIWLEGSSIDGLQTLVELKKRAPDLPIIMISGHGNIDTAVMAIREGAYDYLEKPFKTDRLLLSLARALEVSTLRREVSQLREDTQERLALLGKAPSMQALRGQVDRLSQINSRIFLLGSEGVGRHEIAREIHERSPRRHKGAFIEVFMPAHDEDRQAEILFGYEADGSLVSGAWEQAHRGTLLIDGIEYLSEPVQNRLLMALNGKPVTRINSMQSITSDVRLIAASNYAIFKALEQKRFSADLYERLSVSLLTIPSLSERLSDIPELTHRLTDTIIRQHNLAASQFGAEALDVMTTYDWPGDISQLKNAVERILIEYTGNDGIIGVQDLPDMIGGRLPKLPSEAAGHELLTLGLREARELFERDYLIAQLSRFSHNISRTAENIGMERAALHRKIKTLGIQVEH